MPKLSELVLYFLLGIHEKYDKKRGELNKTSKSKLEKMLKWTEYAVKEGAEFTAYRAMPVLLTGMAAVIRNSTDSYKEPAILVGLSALILYKDFKRTELI